MQKITLVSDVHESLSPSLSLILIQFDGAAWLLKISFLLFIFFFQKGKKLHTEALNWSLCYYYKQYIDNNYSVVFLFHKP